MSILIKDMKMPKECHGCRWFYFQGTSCTEPKYYLDARCELVESGQDWYGKDSRGGWVGESIEHIPGWTGYYSYKHCVEYGTRASQCPFCELPSAQPEHFADVGNMDDGELDFVQKHEKVPVELMVSAQPKPCEDAVSRQTLQKELALYPIDDVTSEDEAGYNRAINDVQKMVLHLPSAQTEIIKCRDCRKYRKLNCPFGITVVDAPDPDGYCYKAERRTDE